MGKTTRSRGRGRPGKGASKKKNDDVDDINADLPGVDDLIDPEDENEGKIAQILRSELVWIRDHKDADHTREENDTCMECPIKKDKQGRGMRTWQQDVAFDFCEKWQDPPRNDDGKAYKTLKYFVSRSKTSDYGQARINLQEQGWKIKEVGELEGEWFRFFGTKENPDGTPRVFEADGEEIEWVQWFAMEYIPPEQYDDNGITA